MSAINTHDQLKHAGEFNVEPVAIIKNFIGIRTTHVYGAAVWHLKHDTDAKGHWTDCGRKVFRMPQEGAYHERIKAAFADAMAWAEKKYGVKEWERNRMGAMVPAPLNTKYPLRK